MFCSLHRNICEVVCYLPKIVIVFCFSVFLNYSDSFECTHSDRQLVGPVGGCW